MAEDNYSGEKTEPATPRKRRESREKGNVPRLSGLTLADIDSVSITVTFAIESGTFSTPADGSAIGSGVTETLVDSKTITLVGSPTDINTYLGIASNIQYLGAADNEGTAADELTLSADDGDGSGEVLLGSVNIDISGVAAVAGRWRPVGSRNSRAA